MGYMVELVATSKGTYAKGPLPGLLLPVHPPPLLTHASTGDSPILAGCFGSVSRGVTVSLPCILVDARFSLCPPRLEPVPLPVVWNSYNQVLLAYKVIFPWDSHSL